MKEDLERIISFYGIRNQLRKFNEECFELIEAINDYEKQKEACENMGCKEVHADIELILMEEEFADVMVMLEQFKAHYNLDNDNIIKTMKFKIARQLERINNENK